MKKLLVFALIFFGGLTAWLSAQATLTNDQIPRLVQSGLSEEFILKLIDQQGSNLSSETAGLVELKNSGVSERLIAAIVKKSPPREPLTSYGLMQLAKAQFSDGFIVDVLERQPVKFSIDPAKIVELKQAGVSERILATMLEQGATRELPAGTEITVRLIDSIDSEKNDEGDEFKATLEDPIKLGDTVVAPKGANAKVKLVAEKDSGKLTGRTELSVRLLSIAVDGKFVPVNTSRVTEGSGSRGVRTAKTAAAVGAVGAIIGAIAGGGQGAAIGAGAGAAAGAGSQVFMKGQRVRIPSETVLTFTTEGIVSLR